ncbi:MAG: HEPN domain-containing protein [Syntrophales bacterium]|nr:HEPN domain-containing protein [Syntrophales bacterium]
MDEYVKGNMQAELDRATETLKAADLLFAHGFINDAISRLYYYVLYNIRALLLSRGYEPRSHEGALRLLGLHFIQPGILQKEVAKIFAKLMKFREEADYNPISMFGKEDYEEFRKEAIALAEAVKGLIGDETNHRGPDRTNRYSTPDKDA